MSGIILINVLNQRFKSVVDFDWLTADPEGQLKTRTDFNVCEKVFWKYGELNTLFWGKIPSKIFDKSDKNWIKWKYWTICY